MWQTPEGRAEVRGWGGYSPGARRGPGRGSTQRLSTGPARPASSRPTVFLERPGDKRKSDILCVPTFVNGDAASYSHVPRETDVNIKNARFPGLPGQQEHSRTSCPVTLSRMQEEGEAPGGDLLFSLICMWEGDIIRTHEGTVLHREKQAV